MKLTDCHLNDHVQYMGDLEVIITKVCPKSVRITDANDGYQFINKLVDPCYLYPTICEPTIITDMLQCQVEKNQRITQKE